MRLLVRSLLLILGGTIFFVLAALVAIWAPDQPVDSLKPRWAGAPSQFAPVGGLLVHLRDEGPRDDPLPLVLVHGTSDSLHTWDGWVVALSSRRRVIRFDLEGFGLTGPNADNDYSITRYVKQVEGVLDHLGVQRVVLAGNSLGGQVAWASALAMPHRVAQLVLVDAGGYGVRAEAVPVAWRAARVPGLRRLLEHLLPRGLILASLRNLYGDPAKVTADLVDRYYDMALRAGNRRALIYRIEHALTNESGRIKLLALPTLIIWGGRDRLIPLQAGQQFARDVAGSRLVVFDDLGHLPHQEDPQRTVRELQRFLGDRHAN